MSQRLSGMLPWAAMLAMGTGAVITLFGFYNLAFHGGEGTVWRWSDDYLLIFLLLFSMIAALAIWRGPFTGGLLVALLIVIVGGVAMQVAVIATLTLSAYVLGRLLLRDPDIAVTDHLLTGMVVFGSLFALLAHVPVNSPGTWGILFVLPILIGWRHVQPLWATIRIRLNRCSEDTQHVLLYSAIFATVLLHVLVSLMPEIGHDALAMHLFLPTQIAYHKAWQFDAGTYAWAVMPMLVDWLYTAGYLLAGETGARLVNVGGIVLLAALVYRIGRWAGAGEVHAAWGVLLLLVTPLTFTESSTLLIEGIWSTIVLGGTLALMRMVTPHGDTHSAILLTGLLLGGALGAKAVTFTMLPVLGLIVVLGYRRWFSRTTWSVSAWAVLLFVAVGAIPYVTAYAITGNPVFPFFNAYFQSPLYPQENFSAPPRFTKGLAWDTLYQMTFGSEKYLESTPGASGFQWILLVMPALVALGIAGHRRALLLASIAAGWMWLAFEHIAYLRYVFPSFALACVLIGAALSIPALEQSWMRQVWMGCIVLVVIVNLLHFHSGTYYGEIDMKVITDQGARKAYIERNRPQRWAAGVVNELNVERRPVAVFSAPLTGDLRSEALYPSWYNWRFFAEARAATTDKEMGHMLAGHHVRYVVVDDTWDLAKLFPLVKEVTVEIARIQTVSVRRLDPAYE